MGSFGGGNPDAMQAVRNAIQRRQGGGATPALNQQTAVSPTAAPVPPSPASARSALPSSVSRAGQQPGQPPSPEAEIILKAMSSRLSSENKIREAGVGLGKVI